MPTKKRFSEIAGRFFKDLFTKNIAIKIISLLFAFLLWGYVLTIENPEYTKVVRDVPITMTGESSLTEKGLVLVTRELGETDVTVLCQIGKHSELDASRITCTVNLSDSSIALAEDEDSAIFPLTVNTTIRNGYGTITSVENSTINVEVARVSTRSGIPVSIEYTGMLPEGFEIETPERLTVSLKGRKSLVNEIAKGVITIDLDAFPTSDPETLAGSYSGIFPIRFYNSSNIALDNIYDDSGDNYSLEVSVTIRAYREFEIVPDIVMEDGYTYQYTLSRKTVKLYGDRNVLLAIDSISTEPIMALPEMNGETVAATLILPDGVSVDDAASGSVTVTLAVNEQTDMRTFVVPITVKGLDANLMRGDGFPTEVEVVVTGTVKKLDAFASTFVTVTLDLSGWTEGTHEIPLVLTLDSRVSDLTASLMTPNVTVTLVAKELPTE